MPGAEVLELKDNVVIKHTQLPKNMKKSMLDFLRFYHPQHASSHILKTDEVQAMPRASGALYAWASPHP